MKLTLLSSLILLSVNLANAQATRTVAIAAGVTSPTGRFAETKQNDSLSGYATMGTHVSLTLEQFNSKGVGLYVQYVSSGINYNAKEKERQYNAEANPSTFQVSEYKVKRYNVSSLNVGALFAMTKYKFNTYIKFGFGISNCRNADLQYTMSDGVNNLKTHEYSANRLTANLNGNIMTSYNISKRTELFISYGYQYQKPMFSVKSELYANGAFIDTEEYKNAKPMAFYNLALGLKFNLTRAN